MNMNRRRTPQLSVIICTLNRSVFLKRVLESLQRQSLKTGQYEIVLIDDGSSDHTRETARAFEKTLPLKYFYQRNAGLASAKNHGIYAAGGDILLFLDDDDIATEPLLEEHLKTHQKYPDDRYAVLHYTKWSPALQLTPLMHFVTEIGHFLFSYPRLTHGDVVDYTFFWGGRSSCKRSFLIEHGVFNPVFRFGCEDIELGYRLSRHGLKVVYNEKAVSMMIRPVGFDDFSRRLIRQGRSQSIFSSLHDDPRVREWAEMSGVDETWHAIKDVYRLKMKAARELDHVANMKMKYGLKLDAVTEKLLHNAYWWSFRACKIKGIIEEKEESRTERRQGHLSSASQT
jgi:glycosyltransferase involved in cell wall biosynthesis